MEIKSVITRLLRIGVTRRKEKHLHTLVKNRIMAVVEPEEVDLLIYSPNLAQGSLMMQSEANFRVLERRII